MTKNISVLGINIKELRQAKNINRNKLSNLTGIDNLILYEIENGDINSLSLSDLEKIAKALDVNISTLLGENFQIYYDKNVDEKVEVDNDKISEYVNLNSDVTIYKLIKHIYRGFGINKDYLTDSERLSIINLLESAINILEIHKSKL